MKTAIPIFDGKQFKRTFVRLKRAMTDFFGGHLANSNMYIGGSPLTCTLSLVWAEYDLLRRFMVGIP
jgi:hypothetical protein